MQDEHIEADAIANRRMAALVGLLLILAVLCLLGDSAKSKPPLKAVKAEQSATADYTATEVASAMKAAWKPSWGAKEKYLGYARLFLKNAKRWGVSPLVVACVAYAESRYHASPPKLMRRRCKTVLKGCDRPGPCWPREVKTCKVVQINTAEAGLMQVLWYDKSTRVGYKKCTGKKLTGKRKARKRKLSPPAVAICVGTYELGKWKRWVAKRKRKQRPKAKANVAFFKRHPELLRFFYTAYYNSGPRLVGNSYVRQVSWCVKRYRKHILSLRAKIARKSP